jgi:hypothetical protein
MKIALICFHKNLGRYPNEWIEIYKNSVLGQTYNNFDIFELNYGNGEERIFDGSFFESIDLKDHAEAHNHLLKKCFSLGYDFIFNTNVDDKYPLDRLQIQIDNIDSDFVIMSGNYTSFSDLTPQIATTNFQKLEISNEFKNNHNIIAHPACLYSRKIVEYNDSLRSEEIPADDFSLWKRLLDKGAKFKILPNVLMYYRISELKTFL